MLRPISTWLRRFSSGWIALLVLQARLVAAGKVHLHRRLGVAGAALAALMLVFGTLTALHGVVRGVSPGGMDPRRFLALPLFALVVFVSSDISLQPVTGPGRSSYR